MYPHHEESIQNLIKYFKDQDGVTAIILGGSIAKGRERPDSDIDAMIIVTPEQMCIRDRHGTMGRFPNAPCALYEIEADEASWLKARRLIQEMERQAPLYKYNICGLPLIRMGIPLNRPYHMVCSQFVAYVLEASGILSLPKPYALFTPMDFTALAGLKLIFRGKLGDLSSTPAVFPLWNPLSDLSETFPALGMK